MLEKNFAPYLDRIAVGLVGSGSQCFGYDDEISLDHDFEPGFCIWLTEKDEAEFGFRLFRAYSKLPKEFMGVKCQEKSIGRASSFGVKTISEFYSAYTGRNGEPETLLDWLYIPSHYLAEATNGVVFSDPLGEFTAVRNKILNGMPEDVRLKKLASCTLHMAQAGQYNYKRCIAHGEHAAARLALDEFIRNGAEAIFLLARRHMPYYKWIFRAMRELSEYSEMSSLLEELSLLPPEETLKIELMIERFCKSLVLEYNKFGLSDADNDFLEPHAYLINGKINNSELRNMHIFYNSN